ncbi:MAG: hypothetical protein ACRDKZ_00210 [Actinomycetota bacterium]
MTKKNRKARRLMSLYPDVRCRILYQRDYLNLLVKYGLEEPSQGTALDKLGSGSADLDFNDPWLGSAVSL